MDRDRIELLALCRVTGVTWHALAREAQRPGGMERLRRRRPFAHTPEIVRTLEAIRAGRDELPRHRREVEEMLRCAERDGIRLVTVLDEDYPPNLRTIHNLPPFLFFRGELREADARAVAVVGTREPSGEGLHRARKIAGLLAESGVTVLSGLARGIDTAAHEQVVESGGRTIAVLGSGIRRVYPPENAGLAERIAKSGAVVSQFWPDAPPVSYNFPRRNVVSSGLGQGTVVIEASSTSGAKMQARFALEHGKRVFLVRDLVDSMEWARRYVTRGAIPIDDVGDVLRFLKRPESVQAEAVERRQLAFAAF